MFQLDFSSNLMLQYLNLILYTSINMWHFLAKYLIKLVLICTEDLSFQHVTATSRNKQSHSTLHKFFVKTTCFATFRLNYF